MSAGVFSRSKYETNAGTILNARVQPETLAANIGAVNAAPAGAVNGLGSAKMRGGSREIGVKARRVTVAFTGAVPDGYKPNSVVSIPIMTPAVYNGISVGTTGTYLGVAVVVIGTRAESVR